MSRRNGTASSCEGPQAKALGVASNKHLGVEVQTIDSTIIYDRLMTVMSDTEILARLQKGELVVDGNPARAVGSSYEFRAGRVLECGPEDSQPEIHDWRSAVAQPRLHAIDPGEMAWVQTAESVKLPVDVCAFWWQTNALSRQGLMLVNMSMVEPGYEGPLACLFVNFGRRPVEISSRTTIAKLVFTNLSSTATRPYLKMVDVRDYDDDVASAARAAADTFLDVSERVNLDLESAQSELAQQVAATKQDLEKYVAGKSSDFEKDAASATRKAVGWAAVGFAMLVAATSFVPWLQTSLSPDLDGRVRSTVRSELSERVVVQGDAESLEFLQETIDELRMRVAELEGK